MRFIERLRNTFRSRISDELISPEVPYVTPSWLTAPPQSADIPWALAVPNLVDPVSQMCTSEQMTGQLYEDLCRAAGVAPDPHRKVWELIYIYAAFDRAGLLAPGNRLLGFGIGMEPLPSAFAARGAQVLATDAPPQVIHNMGWDTTGQHSSGREALYRDYLIDRDSFDERVAHDFVDMNNVPASLKDFDGCWSACALEHLGNIEMGLNFIENSLATLRPGGLAIHTTELNLSSPDRTFDKHNLALFRRRDFELLALRLTSQGHQVAPLNFHPGSGEFDRHVDLPPFSLPHLKLEVGGFVTTSFGMIITKAA